jgi:hypothetical protein
MTQIDLAYFNYAHGGLIGGGARGGGAGYDYTGLVRVIGEDDRWPHLLVMGEGDRYEFDGGDGMWGAAEAMREAGGRPYVPLPCSLPREWGPFAPVIFFDAQTLIVKHFYDHRAPDFAARNRNVLEVRPVGSGERLFAATTHGDLYDAGLRDQDARHLRWLANPALLSAVLADFNEVLSGPHHEPHDLDTNPRYTDPDLAWRVPGRGRDGGRVHRHEPARHHRPAVHPDRPHPAQHAAVPADRARHHPRPRAAGPGETRLRPQTGVGHRRDMNPRQRRGYGDLVTTADHEIPDWLNYPLTAQDHAALPDHVRQRIRLVDGYKHILPPPHDAAPTPADADTGPYVIPAWMLTPLTAEFYAALPEHVRRMIEVVDGWVQIRPIDSR